MKRALFVILTLLLTLSLLTACSSNNGGGNTATLSGKYEIVSFTADGETHDAAAIKEMGFPDWNFEFLSGNKFKYDFAGTVYEGTFKVEGSTVSLTVDGEEMSGKIEGNKITFDAPDGEEGNMVFEKK